MRNKKTRVRAILAAGRKQRVRAVLAARGKALANATFAGVAEEMARPRTAKSARIGKLKLDAARISEQPAIVMSGTVEKIIPSTDPKQPDKALIAVDGAGHRPQDLRIENELTDEHGDDVKLKRGAHVDVTVSAEPKKPTTDSDEDS